MPKIVPPNTKKLPAISVILPVYNGEKFIKKTLESILNQTFKDFEILIIDNASTDHTPTILKTAATQDARIKILTNVKNIGLVGSLNKGLKEAKGLYCARIDADDIALPERFEKQIDFLEKHPNVVAVGTWAEKFDAESGLIKTPTSAAYVRATLLFHSPMVHPSVMLRANILKQHNLKYRPITPVEDFDFWTRLSQTGDLANIPEVLLKYRIHAGSITSRMTNHRRTILRAILAQSLHIQFHFNWQKKLFTPKIIDLHARFAGHEKMTALQIIILPFWLLFLMIFGRNLALIPVVLIRTAAYVRAALKRKLVPPPQASVQNIEDITKDLI